MKVKAAPGLRVPTEDRANAYIEQTPVDVPMSLYYRRLVADGDLIRLPDELSPAGKKGGGKND
ncbi:MULTISPECIES: hypothetical protein [Snodgrassella]|jgi:hypothetical protein|uniref:hypothetical protein n=1 Tax=Snodgrassella TaxID=1193515 RepID=UPI00081595A4|nr:MULTISPECIES: hypothetical protein [Snodgrassella]MCO6514497.1 DUF2635 domain-containing protein [Snodgrassella sp.]MCO6520906.1 DUF2635 domain-containing protein [Snodgrassella sp.]PIT20335.1 hypothetical protein BGI35_08260 [Snodgrassella communis]SCC12575.1 hypothetical protein GA0061082_11013 [Snodgrassella sp. R-53583]